MAKKRRGGKPRVATLRSKPLVSEAEVVKARAAKHAKEQADANSDKNVGSVFETPSSVVCLSRVPHGFYEQQMKKYFSQFGKVKRLRLSRSKKSGRSKGYAFIEFEFPEVAKIAAETMDGYLTYNKIMKCKIMPKDKQHEMMWKGAGEKFKKPWHRKASKERHNSLLAANPDRIHETQKRRVQMEKRKNEKLAKLGIDFKSDALQSEWTSLKGPVKGPRTKKLTSWRKAQGEKKRGGKRIKGLSKDEGSPTQKKAKASDGDESSEDDPESNEDGVVDDSFAKLVMGAMEMEEGEGSSDDQESSDEEEPSDDDEEDSDNEELSDVDEEVSDDTSSPVKVAPEQKQRTGSKRVKSSTPFKEKKELVLPTPKTVGKGTTPKSLKKSREIVSSPKERVKIVKTPGKTPVSLKGADPSKASPGPKQVRNLRKTPAKTPKSGQNQVSPKSDAKLKEKTTGKTPKSLKRVGDQNKGSVKQDQKLTKTPAKTSNTRKAGIASKASPPPEIVSAAEKTPGKTPRRGAGSAEKGPKTPKGWKITKTPK